MNSVIITPVGVVKVNEISKRTDGKTPFTVLRGVYTRHYGGKETKTYFDIQTYDKVAENAAKYLKPGSQIAVQGELVGNEYEKDGKKYTTLVIKADRIEFLPSGKKSTDGTTAAPATTATPAPAEAEPDEAAAAIAAATIPDDGDEEDELPF
jgi:single-strand DNA-binding protein